ncbi:hypothetical protein [Bacillus sp. UNC438CL73TsuS30]|uniref:hypothetical protein n=1 Tax=Bacillus sp. UNC438CL73TsuS30 TaxID=1340434 RepID=UPI00047C732F|nr:hypothetical protein [Bacillus sp. UNC438CL73TsuS30]
MDIRSMIESVVKDVVQSMKVEKENEKVGKVLFVFCDSSAHERFTDQFIKLKNNKIGYDLLFLDGETSSWLGMQRVESSGSDRIIAADEYSPAAIELPKGYDGIIIPEIDLDNAARVVTGLKGTIKAEIMFSGILLEKFLIVGEDTPGIKRADRLCLKVTSLPGPYRKQFEFYVKAMKELGIEFSAQKDLADVIIDKFRGKLEESPTALIEESAGGLENGLTFKKKLLTPEWIQAQKEFPNQTLYLPKGVIISPLAKDLIKEKKLAIKFTGKG